MSQLPTDDIRPLSTRPAPLRGLARGMLLAFALSALALGCGSVSQNTDEPDGAVDGSAAETRDASPDTAGDTGAQSDAAGLDGSPDLASDAAAQTDTAAPDGPAGNDASVDGAACTANDKRCSPTAPNTVQICSAGTWQDVTPCTYVCNAGVCAGTCTPGARRCGANGVPQLCSAAGEWQDQAACVTGATCQDGSCACTLTTCGTACVDLDSNPDHCGTCNHSCLGGACSSGLCQPVVLASSESALEDIAVDANNVYWTNDVSAGGGSVKKMPIRGGSVAPLVSAEDGPRGVASDGTTVYFTSGLGLRAVPAAGGSATTLATRLTGTYPNRVVVDGAYVYWTEHANTSDGASMIRRVPRAGGPAETLATTAPGAGAEYLTVAGGYVFFNQVYTYQVARVPAAGGTITTIWTGTADKQPRKVASDGTYLFIAAGDLIRSTLTGSSSMVFVADGASPLGLAVDATNVYHVSGTDAVRACGSNWTINRTPKTGGTPTAMATTQSCPLALVVDATALYYINYQSSEVMKLAK